MIFGGEDRVVFPCEKIQEAIDEAAERGRLNVNKNKLRVARLKLGGAARYLIPPN
jgi:hypothetical protein